MKIENYIEEIDSSLAILLQNMEYKDYVNFIKSERNLEKYDYILGEFIDYEEIPEEYRIFFTEEKLKTIIEYINNKIKELKLNEKAAK